MKTDIIKKRQRYESNTANSNSNTGKKKKKSDSPSEPTSPLFTHQQQDFTIGYPTTMDDLMSNHYY